MDGRCPECGLLLAETRRLRATNPHSATTWDTSASGYRRSLCAGLIALSALALEPLLVEVAPGSRALSDVLNHSAWWWFRDELLLGLCLLLLYMPERRTQAGPWSQARRRLGWVVVALVSVSWFADAGFYFENLRLYYSWAYGSDSKANLHLMGMSLFVDLWLSPAWWLLVLLACLDVLRRLGSLKLLIASAAVGGFVVVVELLGWSVHVLRLGAPGGIDALADLEGYSALHQLRLIGWRVNEGASAVMQASGESILPWDLLDMIAVAMGFVIVSTLAAVARHALVSRRPAHRG